MIHNLPSKRFNSSHPHDPHKVSPLLVEVKILCTCHRSYLLSVELHLAYYIQLLSKQSSTRKEEILVEIYDEHTSTLLRRLVILAMTQWKCHYWISDVKQNYTASTEWERRAMILGSYCLGDEGRHWRDNTKKSWNEIELLIREWYSDRIQKDLSVPI